MRIINKVTEKVLANVFNSATIELPITLIDWLMRGFLHRMSSLEDTELSFTKEIAESLSKLRDKFVYHSDITKTEDLKLLNKDYPDSTKVIEYAMFDIDFIELNTILWCLKGMISHCNSNKNNHFNQGTFNLMTILNLELLELKQFVTVEELIEEYIKEPKTHYFSWQDTSNNTVETMYQELTNCTKIITCEADREGAIEAISSYDFLGTKEKLSNLDAVTLAKLAESYNLSTKNTRDVIEQRIYDYQLNM